MSHRKRVQTYGDLSVIEVKSKLEAEFRRFNVKRDSITGFEEFFELVQCIHRLYAVPFDIFYRDPLHGDLLPINNTENCIHALNTAQPLLRLFLQRKGESIFVNGVSEEQKRKSFFAPLISSTNTSSIPGPLRSRLNISTPQDFRRVSAIIDVDILPETVRRVRLCKHNSDKPLGFYIRDGTSVKVTLEGIEKVPGIFISRLVPGGLAESTGLLSVNDEVLEVNGIEVSGKSLDQVTDMMVANSHNLIVTVRPVNQIPTKTSTLPPGMNTRKVTMSQSLPATVSNTRAPNGPDSSNPSGILENSTGPLPDSDEEDDEPIISGGIVHV